MAPEGLRDRSRLVEKDEARAVARVVARARASARGACDARDDRMATAASARGAASSAEPTTSATTTSCDDGSRKRGRDAGAPSGRRRGDGERERAGGDGGDGSAMLGSTLYKRRTRQENGKEFARRLIDFRGFDLSEAQANDIARFIDLLPEEMEERVREVLENCVDIDDAITKLASVKMVEQTAQCSVGDFSEAAISEAHSGRTGGDRGDADRDTATATSSAPVLTLEWVNAVVNEMGASVDVSDAQNRASRVLQTFEGAVRQKCAEFNEHNKMMKLKRENALLKRAVAIQNSRMQDLKPLQTRVRELEAACAQYDAQLKAAERQNYSLSVNLRLAMAEQSPFGSKNHDVF